MGNIFGGEKAMESKRVKLERKERLQRETARELRKRVRKSEKYAEKRFKSDPHVDVVTLDDDSDDDIKVLEEKYQKECRERNQRYVAREKATGRSYAEKCREHKREVEERERMRRKSDEISIKEDFIQVTGYQEKK